jgi:glutamyl/glutaminyl-tRNA synthetase
VNAHYLHHASGETLLEWGAAFLPPGLLGVPQDRLIRILEVVRGNLATLADLATETRMFLSDLPPFDDDARLVLSDERARQVCGSVSGALGELDELDAESFKSALQRTGGTLQVKGRALFQPVRAALTGATHGPELPLIAELLGRTTCVNRLESAALAGGQPEWRP